MARVNHFALLLWKNYLLQRRKVVVTILEIGLPTLFAIVVILIRQRVESEDVANPMRWKSFTLDMPDGLIQKKKSLLGINKIFFSPNTTLSNEIMTEAKALIDPDLNVTGFDDEESATQQFLQRQADDVLAVVVFKKLPNSDEGNKNLNVEYKLRFPSILRSSKQATGFSLADNKHWMTELMFPVFQKIGPRNNGSKYGGPPDYRDEGFLSLQYAIDMAVAKIFSHDNKSSEIDLRMQRLSYPPFLDDNFVLVIQQQLPLIIVLSFIFYSMQIVKDLVYEKEQKLKESMKLMGLAGWLHWLAWFVKYFIFMLISISIETLLFCVNTGDHGAVISYASPSVIFVFLLLYGVATISFCFAISTFFSKANTSAAIGGLIFFLSFIPYSFLQPRYDTLSWPSKIVGCLLSNVAMAFGAQVIGMFEGTGTRVEWQTINHSASVDDTFTMLHVLLMLIIDAIIYAIIAWYVEAVYPGDYGIPQLWYFPIQRSYWCGMSQLVEVDEDEDDRISLETDPLLSGSRRRTHRSAFFEDDPSGLRPGIRIKNLRKEFKNNSGSKVAVADMTLNFYEGQITALLGHNGAGKTTTMSILTGFFPPTAGTALINGYDILKDIVNVRTSLGFCPQHNILFDSLTVEEHLIFFTKLKGLPKDLVAGEVEKVLTDIDLVEKRNCLVSALSGGMKRKLSVGIALTGRSKVVILDEPSSGMDPNARRHLWDFLQRSRHGRTILISTHFMDEADALGDRIAIMADGVVQCCGTSLFLKTKYGAGYHLIFALQSTCDVNEITNFIRKFVPESRLTSNIGSELAFILPFESKGNFEHLFEALDNSKPQLRFMSYGVSVTTMEEVFLRAGSSADSDAAPSTRNILSGPELTPESNEEDEGVEEDVPLIDNSFSSSSNIPPTDYSNNLWDLESSPKKVGFRLLRQQFQAMFVKRVLHSSRNLVLSISQLLVPLALTIISLIVIKTSPSGDHQPPLVLDMSSFSGAVVPYGISNGSLESISIAKEYARYLKSFSSCHLVNVSTKEEYKNYSTPVDQYVIVEGQHNLPRYNRHFLIALDFPKVSKSDAGAPSAPGPLTIAYFSNQAFHASAISLNALDNAIYRQTTGDASAGIVTVNHPMPVRAIDTIDSISMSIEGFGIALNAVFGMSFLASSFVLFLVRERSSKAKHSQFISGVDLVVFWTSTLLWDLINFLIPCIGIIIVFAAFKMDQYVGNGRWAEILLLFFLYGWAVIPMMYLMSFIFKVPSTGFIWLTILNIISGVATLLSVAILSIPALGTQDLANALEWVFLVFFPNYCLGQGLEDFYSNNEFIKICDAIEPFCIYNNTLPCCSGCQTNCLTPNDNYLGIAPKGIGRMIVFLTSQGCCFFMMLLVIESNIPWWIFYSFRSLSAAKHSPSGPTGDATRPQEDDDVVEERNRIHNSPLSYLAASEAIILKDLTKHYGRLVAVDKICAGIRRGDCFGLLGINGAGKTSTFQMLTGDTLISDGVALILGHDLKRDFNKIQLDVGYCPQFDALIEQMTGRETLEMYANLRGLDKHEITASISYLSDMLLLKPYMNKLVKSYSGGTKRKLSTAVALIGGPRIIFLDEPSSGMDPTARRHLWDTLIRVRDAGRTLVLTSHSMEECEALCTKIAIMVNGQFRCLGSTQHLKSKFGKGYTLIVKIRSDSNVETSAANAKQVQDFIETTFPGSILKDVHQGLLHFHITDTTVKLGRLFGAVESARARFHLEDYSISQTTLEQVFIHFAQSQLDPNDLRASRFFSCGPFCRFGLCCGLFCPRANPAHASSQQVEC